VVISGSNSLFRAQMIPERGQRKLRAPKNVWERQN
jgi:hypothetical protein